VARMTSIGFDLDNTIINYDMSAQKYGQKIGLEGVRSISELKSKLKVGGLTVDEWTRAQSWIYGEGIAHATVQCDLLPLLEKLADRKYSIHVVSHKTEFGPRQFGSVPFVEFTLQWLNNSSLGSILEKNVNLFFEETRRLKVQRISQLSLDFFVDDLVEVINDKDFPEHTIGILYGDIPLGPNKPQRVIQNFSQLLGIVAASE
jgi:hypothetical protein